MLRVKPASLQIDSDNDTVVVVCPPEQGGRFPPLMTIGHEDVSQTFMPHIATAKAKDCAQITFCKLDERHTAVKSGPPS